MLTIMLYMFLDAIALPPCRALPEQSVQTTTMLNRLNLILSHLDWLNDWFIYRLLDLPDWLNDQR